MSKIVLAKDSVFPVVSDRNGNKLETSPQTGFSFPGTIQGEGKLAGTTALFIRLAGCNLRCIWKLMNNGYSKCDTPYASFNTDEVVELDVNDVVEIVKQNIGPIKYIVISGGEPLLQKDALAKLCQKLKLELNVHLTLETNGTLFSEDVAKWIDLFSISPKLKNAEPTSEKLKHFEIAPADKYNYNIAHRRKLGVLQKYIDLHNQRDQDLQFKFVVGRQEDEHEIKQDYLEKLKNWKTEDIMLMPLGASMKQLDQTQHMVLQMAIINGWRFSPRMHIELFGTKIGV